MKRATRWKAEVVNGNGVAWEVLVHDFPDAALRSALDRAGFKVRRASAPRDDDELPMVYSELDPVTSIEAAREHAGRRETQIGNVLLHLLDHRGEWVTRETIRAVGGDSGDRRVRELRDRNWPIDISQRIEGAAWHVRLALSDSNGHDPMGLF